jgi:Xaa-Pro aminopeptidase
MVRSSVRAFAALLVCAGSLTAQIPTSEYAARRAALASRIDSGVVIAYGGREPVRHTPPFYQLPSFRYLTGSLESDAAFAMVKSAGVTTSVLFMPRPDPRRALYYGTRKAPAEVALELELQARWTDEFEAFVDSLVDRGLPVYSVSDIQAAEFSRQDSITPGRLFVRQLRTRHPGLTVREIDGWVDEMRGRKSAGEIAILKKAADVTSRAHEAAMRTLRPGMGENEVQAVMEETYRSLGADGPGYSSIVGSGPNSTVLHYPAGMRKARSGEVVLMDVGAYYDGYSADITRTIPVDATFTPAQRELYAIVLAAEKAGERQLRPGGSPARENDSIYAVFKTGLVRLGLIESENASFDPPPGLCPGTWANADGSCPQWYLYAYHGFSHGIGLDVHDPAQFSNSVPHVFQPGDVFTIEPGLYVREQVLADLPDTPRNRSLVSHAQGAVARYRNTGIRIEDNYLITQDGVERITSAPREIDDVEALRKEAFRD